MTSESPAPSGYIVGRTYDWAFFIGAPLMAIGLAMFLTTTEGLTAPLIQVGGVDKSILTIGILIFINAHLVLAFARSHFNQNIFRLYPGRFIAAPIILLVMMLSFTPFHVFMVALAVWWDVYHSALQTFGIGRIYDARAKNPPTVGRRLDQILNIYIYAGPILAGAVFLDHVGNSTLALDANYLEIGAIAVSSIPSAAQGIQQYLAWGILGTGIPFLAYYIFAYRRLARAGYHVSRQKVWLYAITALCSIIWWGFNPFADAFFVMNFFHAFQYFGIVWWAENKNLKSLLRVGGIHWARTLVPVSLMIGVTFAYGVWVTLDTSWLTFNILTLVAILHFWYDGFIWSVRKGQV